MNELILIGRISNDLELKDINGKKITNFRVAVNTQGAKGKASFIPCVAFDVLAENLTKYQKKGSQIALKGYLKDNEYEDKDGNKRYTLNVVATNIKYLDSIKDVNQQVMSSEINDDDVPF